MRKLSAALLLFLFSHGAAAIPDGQALLEYSDAVRNPDRSFRLTVLLTSYKDEHLNQTTSLVLYSRADPNKGQYRSLLHFTNPSRDAGKLTLKNGKDLWIFDPRSKASVPISPQQRLLGQAANGDVVTANWGLDYTVTGVTEESILDGDRIRRDSYKLDLKARRPDVTYDTMELWIDKDGYRTRKAKFYAASKALLKTAYYRSYRNALGRDRPTETIIIDGVNSKWVTIMRYDDFAWQDVPDAWLQRDYLPRFQPVYRAE
ncbi:outer membrane lipoprotein-sorting protein [Achromobacter sp. NPDC058515]|uniref:outer membrane lipoprotein-sorting protein n=1 Tax=Achromobacter sp. NPDC058515 TaxID=3346533 RepID=UPI0036478430